MKRDLPVSSIMTRKISAVGPTDSLEHVREIFEKHGFHHAPVVEHGKLVGIVSYTDYLRVINDYFYETERKSTQLMRLLQVKDMMTANPVSLRPDDTVGVALQIFRENPFHALPVTDENQKLLGLLTTYDLMKVFEDILAPERLSF